ECRSPRARSAGQPGNAGSARSPGRSSGRSSRGSGGTGRARVSWDHTWHREFGPTAFLPARCLTACPPPAQGPPPSRTTCPARLVAGVDGFLPAVEPQGVTVADDVARVLTGRAVELRLRLLVARDNPRRLAELGRLLPQRGHLLFLGRQLLLAGG